MDEPRRERIRDDLKGLVKGELLFDDLARTLYSTDASIFEVRPLAVAVPRDEEDVQALVRYAASQRLPLIPRGAGTGLAGEALGAGLVMDLSQHFRRIGPVGAETVRVQPGVVLRELNARLAPLGRRFAPDPASGDQCTVGGMLATDASGARVLRHGYTHDHVAEIRVVFDTGEAAWVGREPRQPAPERSSGRLAEIVHQTSLLLEKRAELIAGCRPRTPFDRCGYRLFDVLSPEHLDLPRLLVGSEGTLALFTEATLRTVPLPGGRSVVLLGFDRLDAALQAAQEALPSGPSACELLDRRLVSLARGRDGSVLVPTAAEAVLLIEYETATPSEAREAAGALASRLQRGQKLARHAIVAVSPADCDRLWQLRQTALPTLFGLRGGPQPLPFVEDVAVPPGELPTFVHRAQDVLQRQETIASFLIHAGSGQVHLRPFLDLGRPEDVAKMWALAEEIHGLALELGGTISSQHGTGLARTPWVERQYGRLYSVFRELKAIFDPQGLFNPGKIVGPLPGMPAWPLRTGLRQQGRPGSAEAVTWLLTPGLRAQHVELHAEALHCNGCGHCRTSAAEQRMCPLFRVTHAEAAAPRAKANLVRQLLRPDADPRLFSADEVRAVADLCVNCKMCARECPARVNIPKLMLQAKAANVAEYGLRLSDWVMSRTESLAALGSAFALLVNAGLASGSVRWLLEQLVGLSRLRRLPRFASRSFLRRAARRGWTRPVRSQRPRVAYFVDVFANYNDPSIAEAAVAVLHHNGIEVYVPPGQRGCGMAPLACGDVEAARETAEHNLRLLAELVRDGYRVVCTEPTAALMLRQDCLDLFDDPDARLVADGVDELTAYLVDLHAAGRLRQDFQPLDLAVGHHVPCHLKALGRPPAGPQLLALIPGLRVHTIDVSCSGMAGTFGLKAENYAVSQEAGRPMLDELRRPRVQVGSTECGPCRLQIEDGSRKRTLHPVQYLALAYGLMPELARRLHEPIGELVL